MNNRPNTKPLRLLQNRQLIPDAAAIEQRLQKVLAEAKKLELLLQTARQIEAIQCEIATQGGAK